MHVGGPKLHGINLSLASSFCKSIAENNFIASYQIEPCDFCEGKGFRKDFVMSERFPSSLFVEGYIYICTYMWQICLGPMTQ